MRRKAAWHHAAAILLGLLALPLLWLALDLVRLVVDETLARPGGAGAVVLGRIALPAVERLDWPGRVLWPGFSVPRRDVVLLGPLALAGTGILLALLAIGVGRLRAGIGTRAIASLRRTMIDAVLVSRPAARDEARDVAALAGEGLARESGFLGGAVLVPVLGGAGLALVLGFGLASDWRLAAAMAVALTCVALAWPGRLAAIRRSAEARLTEGAATRRALLDLTRRLPAIRSHGTAAFERERLVGELDGRHGAVRLAERRLHAAGAGAVLVVTLAPAIVLAAGAWLSLEPGGPSTGTVVACMAGTAFAFRAVAAILQWRRSLDEAAPLFDEIARRLGALQSRGRDLAGAAIPASGALQARDLMAYDPASGTRLSGVDLMLGLPSHVALVGEAGSGNRVLAALVGGALDPSSGTLTFGGANLAGSDPAARAGRIAYAGGETVLIAGSLRQNLVYGASEVPDLDTRLVEAVTAVGLDRFVYARGLAGTVDPAREPKLAAAIVDARRKVRAALAAEGCEDLVDPFDPKAYNTHATIAENILFGVPLGDTFRDANLASHPFVRAIMETEDLTKPLSDMGLSIARAMVEIFADLPDGHPLFERFGFFPAGERAYFEDVVARQGVRQRGADQTRDRENLIGLALRYNESRHRLGFLDESLMGRLLKARAAFAELLPTSLQPAIEFYHPDRICAAASLQDNLLFGRLAQDRAGAERDVMRVVRRVLVDRGLDGDVVRIGLDTRVDLRGDGLLPTEIAAIDLARCLVRRPDVLVVERALDGLSQTGAADLVARLRRAMVGRGLIVVAANLAGRMDEPPFDAVVRFERGTVAAVEVRRREAAAA
ncbi:ABC transporter ATP-binding protein [Salinarimonas soli]|uniref:ABC transporter ATP-binding protein n=1 Tax=Salinarimonas soli TaxID=1638099 RepID=A0A5B2VHP1_9HYPH|nr:ABC transporter ATP-binding protein [Salinarimonas soli]KAA2237872.1 ABC transporter ATP-binding protein [Salinarimonas soli]